YGPTSSGPDPLERISPWATLKPGSWTRRPELPSLPPGLSIGRRLQRWWILHLSSSNRRSGRFGELVRHKCAKGDEASGMPCGIKDESGPVHRGAARQRGYPWGRGYE